MEPIKFSPYLKSVIWGGDLIAKLKNIETTQTNIGESWELSGVPGNETCVLDGPDKGLPLSALIDKYGARLVGNKVFEKYGNKFPLLVKIIDAHDDLSVQVHPDDRLAAKRHNCDGKTEMWYILDTTPGAKIYAGLSRRLTPDTYRHEVESKSIMSCITAHDSHPGDVFFLPAGRVHAIGAGNLLLEIQQTSDITYRIYDYDRRDANGNPRELHTELAADAIDYQLYDNYKSAASPIAPAMDSLAKCDYFDVRLLNINGQFNVDYADGSFVIITCTKGSISVTTDGAPIELKLGETVLVPAERYKLTISGNGNAVTAHI